MQGAREHPVPPVKVQSDGVELVIDTHSYLVDSNSLIIVDFGIYCYYFFCTMSGSKGE